MSLPWDASKHAMPGAAFEPQIGSQDENSIDGTWEEEFRESAQWLSRGFWAATAVRAVRTFAQTMVATVTAAGVGVPLQWYDCALTSLGAAGLSVLMSIDRNIRS